MVLDSSFNSSSTAFFSFLSSKGRNPSKQNLLVLSPDSVSAVMQAAGPGREVTVIPASWHIFTSTSPGSDMAGVPASVISAIFFPACSLFIKSYAFSTLLYS